MFRGLLLLVNVRELVLRCVFGYFSVPKDDVGLLLQCSSGHVVRNYIGISGYVAVGNRLA